MEAAVGVDVVELEPDDLASAADLVDRVWGAPPGRPLLEERLLRAFHLAGEQLLGAYRTGRAHDADALVGVSVAFVGTHLGGVHLHSHVTGVDHARQLHGIGYELKLAQRDWALARGIIEVRWTFDPLMARNAHFNLTKLGARGAAYHVDLYGPMLDAMNAGGESDRVEAVWDLGAPVGGVEPDVEALCARGAAVILSSDGTVWPEATLEPVLLASTTPDIAALRHNDAEAARRWRQAAREAIGRAISLGYVATGASRDGWWVLERNPTAPGRTS